VTNVRRSREDIGRRSIILGIYAPSNLRLRPVLQATLTLQGGFRSPFRLSLALIGFALPFE
jgi:hypothetical protein